MVMFVNNYRLHVSVRFLRKERGKAAALRSLVAAAPADVKIEAIHTDERCEFPRAFPGLS